MVARPTAIFFVYVWPEPRSSAAGVRTRELMSTLQRGGWRVGAVSPSGDSPYRSELEALGIFTISCDPNRSEETDSQLRGLGPDLCLFDRFVMEEQFGWRARDLWPQALQIVDTQDLHSLRRARQRLAQQGASWNHLLEPEIEDLGEDLLREIASLYRADGALVVSSYEASLLDKLGYPSKSLLHLPFPADADPSPPSFAERNGFCFLGNFRHPPNIDSVRWLLTGIWPKLREQFPAAELHLYGAYPPAEISQHKGAKGIFAHGPVIDHREKLRSHRVLFAPLRFGAGVKGKVLEAWGSGTPVLGTPLTFEGMGEAGIIALEERDLASAALNLHENQSDWDIEQKRGLGALRKDYDRSKLDQAFLCFLEQKRNFLSQQREKNLIGRMLRHQQHNATKYFSRWIEAKNAKLP